MMTMDKLESMTEPYRTTVGWVSIAGGIAMFLVIGFIAQTVTHNKYVMTDNNRVLKSLDGGHVVQPSPVIVYLRGKKGVKHGLLVNWPQPAKELLGWTASDIHNKGLEIIIPHRFRSKHEEHVAKALETPDRLRVKRTIQTFAMHKDGDEIPVKLTVWVDSDGTATTVNAVIVGRPEN